MRLAVELHAARCERCRGVLSALAIAAMPESDAERALVDRVLERQPTAALVSALLGDARERAVGAPVTPRARRRDEDSPLRRPTPRWSGGRRRVASLLAGGALAASAVVAFVATDRGILPSDIELPYRAAEGRPALATLPYVTFEPLRGEDRDPPAYEDAIGWSLARDYKATKTFQMLSSLYLWRGERGDRERAEESLLVLQENGRRDNDIGVLLLSLGEPEGALMAFSAALDKEETLIEATFNRALALEGLKRREPAIDAWGRYLGKSKGDETGWRDEARKRQGDLINPPPKDDPFK
ncbi:hypothetical protein AKJ08_2655 [Vulgatibacter incomptus]|uniref:Tetratricopeptide repeat protein n=1 Tax=Vulgatibacter incomptus TaxID=1391653 RepID=A0A0K1PFG2_9BACT|nr:hypothetical protein AKJ08_2655 [Vulgatibacter incomptus]